VYNANQNQPSDSIKMLALFPTSGQFYRELTDCLSVMFVHNNCQHFRPKSLLVVVTSLKANVTKLTLFLYRLYILCTHTHLFANILTNCIPIRLTQFVQNRNKSPKFRPFGNNICQITFGVHTFFVCLRICTTSTESLIQAFLFANRCTTSTLLLDKVLYLVFQYLFFCSNACHHLLGLFQFLLFQSKGVSN